MEFGRSFLRLTIILTGTPAFFGCHHQSEQDRFAATAGQGTEDSGEPASIDHLASARRMLRARDWDAAADAAYKALVQDPDNADATLVASEAEAGRGSHQLAAELAGSIDRRSSVGRRAVELQYEQLMKLNQPSDAADVILEARKVIGDETDWLHRAWETLNRAGRREEASLQAVALCRSGQATEPQMHSLIRRHMSFPFKLAEGAKPEEHFAPGLGMARWYFTREDHGRALKELSTQFEIGFKSTAACALYGRLLAETQAFEDFPAWHARCDKNVRAFGDYWAALGTYFYDQHQFEASARAFLEAVYRNPTDRVCLQRLSKVFSSLDRLELGIGFRDRGIEVFKTEEISDALMEGINDDSLRLKLVNKLAALGRPFETLQWTMSVSVATRAERLEIDRQRDELQRTRSTWMTAAKSSLLGVARRDLNIEDAMKLLESSVETSVVPSKTSVEVLARPRLVNVAPAVGIEFQWYKDVEIDLASIPLHEQIGGGIAVLDYDMDGWPDAYFAQGSGEPPTDQCTRSNVLVRNLQGRFADATPEARVEDRNYSSGLASGDVNQDGFPDLFLGSLGHNRLLINNGDGTFTDATDRLGKVEDRFTASLAIADINGDGLPDLFETNYIEMEGAFVLPKTDPDGKPVLPGPLDHVAGLDRWFDNKGDGSFGVHEITREITDPGTSLGIIITDFDSDGGNEVFVGNDMRPNHFLVHTGENEFLNLADSKGIANGYRGVPDGCMGISAADFNRDGAIDLHITNYYLESDNFYIQTAGGLFTDLASRYGIDKTSKPMVGWGAKAIDIDRNGWLDLIVTNGHIFDTRIYGEPMFRFPPQMLMRQDGRFELVDVDDESGYWDDVYLGRAMASLDFDRDGSIDFLIGHMDKPVALLQNQTASQGDWIQLELVGTDTERDAIGTRVVVTAGGQSFTHWVTAGDGYSCTDEPVLDFGLGVEQDVARVDVFWSGGDKQVFDGLQSRHRYLIIEGQPEAVRR